MKISVIGTGYVGLVAGTCFAEVGHDVICVDKDQKKIQGLLEGKLPIFEPGLEELVKRNSKEGRLHFSTSTEASIQNTDVIFIAVGTPSSTDGRADMAMFLEVAHAVGKAMNGYKIIVNKSTVPVGTAKLVSDVLKKTTTHPFDVVSNPEFLKEGSAIDDFLHPDRVVIGASSEAAFKTMSELYKPFLDENRPIIFMSNLSAELTKYAANAFLATKISFMNSLSQLCDAIGENTCIDSVRKGMSTDRRIGQHFLNAGIGYGGSCFPKDVKALLRTAEDYKVSLPLVSAAEEVNQHQKGILFQRIEKDFHNQLQGKQFALWGLAFKPNTDDMREAASLVLMENLVKAGARVVAYDPIAIEEAKKALHRNPVLTSHASLIQFVDTPYSALEGSDALIIATEWNEFLSPDFDRMKSLLKTPKIYDGRNIYEKKFVTSKGFQYSSIGRPSIT